MSRTETDRKRYLRQREARLAYQRVYYKEHREQCRQSVRRSERRRIIREISI